MFLNIDLRQLRPHPGNANVMPERLLAKLEAHIRAGGNYPALIVRALPPPPLSPPLPPHPPAGPFPEPRAGEAAREPEHVRPAVPQFQILDGHHRAVVLRRLGHRAARCEVWQGIDDRAAAMLLLTLNRLRGEDDPFKRGGLLQDLARDVPPHDLARLLPEDADRIERLMALCRPPAEPIAAPAFDDLPQALTFFLGAVARRAAVARLRAIHADRSRALLMALGIDESVTAAATEGEGAGCAQEKAPRDGGASGDQ